MNETVLAAGILCWRKQGNEPLILLVHRPLHQDVSYPKGKVDPGESLPEAAVREVREETGLAVTLGAPLAVSEYSLPGGRPKRVYYWSAFVPKSVMKDFNFTPNSEVSKLSWVTFPEAKKLLSYRRDIEVLDQLQDRIEQKVAKSYALIALRHAKAKLPESWDGNDDSRPLRSRGYEEVIATSRKIYPYQPKRIITSPATRCQETVAELSHTLNIEPVIGPTLRQNQSSWFDVQLGGVISDVLKTQKTTLLCSHGPVIPTILSELVSQTNSKLTREIFRSSVLNTAEFVVIHLSKASPSKIIGVERYAPRSVESQVPFGNSLT